MAERGGSAGVVYLVGAGPGDRGLLTLKGAQCLHEAHVVVYDEGVSRAVLGLARETVELRMVPGGQGAAEAADELAGHVIRRAGEGRVVVRLVAGDACLEGARHACAGDLGEALAAAGVAFELVPGVGTIAAATAYAAMFPMGRQTEQAWALVGGAPDDAATPAGGRRHLAGPGAALAMTMPWGEVPAVVAQLLGMGYAPETEAALVLEPTTPRQRTLRGPLVTIVNKLEPRQGSGEAAPVVLFLGGAARLRPALAWFEAKPLFGKRIVVTRPAGAAATFAALLERAGAEVIPCPVIEPRPLDDYASLDAALRRLGEYDWLLFTSVHGVRFFAQRLWEVGLDLRAIGQAKLCAIGPKTAAEIERLRLRVDLMPAEYRAEGVLAALLERAGGEVAGLRFLLPRALVAREVLPEMLRERGAVIDVVPAYRTVLPAATPAHAAMLEHLEQRRVAAITFTSSSTVTNFFSVLPQDRAAELLHGIVLASIGPVTSDTLREHGLTPTVTADEYTIEGLTRKLLEYFQERRQAAP
ncbi:MAG: uroporphyrinogen-III synthase [Candidatus Tectomicrobia bacterium]|nr:uroporphyrinogen-III synthase [Candidatus Tectomicrobia bacterium]